MASKAFRVRAELKPRSSTQPGSSSPLDLEAPLRVSSTAYNNRKTSSAPPSSVRLDPIFPQSVNVLPSVPQYGAAPPPHPVLFQDNRRLRLPRFPSSPRLPRLSLCLTRRCLLTSLPMGDAGSHFCRRRLCSSPRLRWPVAVLSPSISRGRSRWRRSHGIARAPAGHSASRLPSVPHLPVVPKSANILLTLTQTPLVSTGCHKRAPSPPPPASGASPRCCRAAPRRFPSSFAVSNIPSTKPPS